MGLRRSAGIVSASFIVLALSSVGASPHDPTVFFVAWGEVPEQFFPHPDLCIGSAQADRQRSLGAGYYLDPDGCAEAERAFLGFADRDASGGYSVGDALYVQPASAMKVREGDLRLGRGAPSEVAASHADTGRTTRPLPLAQWDFVDGDGDRRWSSADVAYADVDQNGFLSPGDAALGEDLRKVDLGSIGMFYALNSASGGLCFVDDDGSGDWDANEPAYLVLSRPCDHVGVGDLRIAATRGLASGSLVIEAALDYRNPLTVFPAPQGTIRWSDSNAVLDLDGSATLTPTDVVIDGKMGRAADDADGSALDALGRWAFVDLDGDGMGGPRDLVYIDRDGNGRTSAGDVRFSRFLDHPFGSVVQDGDADDLLPLPPKQKPVTGSPIRDEVGEDTRGSPAPGLVPFLLFFAFGFLAGRRRAARRP